MPHDLAEMLEFQRPAFSVYEEAFIDRYIRPLDPEQDAYGNLWLDIGETPTTLWSSHTDTVHAKAGFQRITTKNGIARLSELNHREGLKPTCLGADCTTGVWLMLEMIDAKVPGRYVFHRAEEIGGKGSSFVAAKTPERLAGINFAIAFDRRGQNEVITRQGFAQTASNTFADSLAEQLGMGFKKSANGIFTDTANYDHIVPECTNISVGYEHAHSVKEYQDLNFAFRLRDRICKIDTSKLIMARDPKKTHRVAYKKSTMDATEGLVYRNPKAVAALIKALSISEDQLRNWIVEYHNLNSPSEA
jgi:hypothetical protein